MPYNDAVSIVENKTLYDKNSSVLYTRVKFTLTRDFRNEAILIFSSVRGYTYQWAELTRFTLFRKDNYPIVGNALFRTTTGRDYQLRSASYGELVPAGTYWLEETIHFNKDGLL